VAFDFPVFDLGSVGAEAVDGADEEDRNKEEGEGVENGYD